MRSLISFRCSWSTGRSFSPAEVKDVRGMVTVEREVAGTTVTVVNDGVKLDEVRLMDDGLEILKNDLVSWSWNKSTQLSCFYKDRLRFCTYILFLDKMTKKTSLMKWQTGLVSLTNIISPRRGSENGRHGSRGVYVNHRYGIDIHVGHTIKTFSMI